MSQSIAPRLRQPGELTGWHVLGWLAAFFGIVFAVNGYFLVSALSTHTGIVSQEPYRKGLHYNTRIAADARQAALGWTSVVTIADDKRVHVVLADKAGLPVGRLVLTGLAGRPSTNRFDHALTFREVAPGRYEAAVDHLVDGAWLVAVEARLGEKDAEPVYRARRRLWFKP